MRPRVALPALALAAALGACAQPAGPVHPYRLTGTLRDAATNEPLSRKAFFLHFFCDDAGFQESLNPEDETGFDVRLPTPNVRIRAFDPGRTYAFLTETFTLTAPETQRDILVRPTGYVLFRARVVDASGAPLVPSRPAGGATPTVGGGGPLFYLRSDTDAFQASLVHLDDTGAFAIRVPRAVIHLNCVDTALSLVEKSVDLSKAEGAEFEYVIRME